MDENKQKNRTDNQPIGQAIHSLWQLMAGYRLLYGAAIFAMLLSTCFNFTVPLIGSGVIDYALGAGNGSSRIVDVMSSFVDKDWLTEHLWSAALIILIITILGGFSSYFKGRWSALASDGIARRLKNQIYDHLQRLPMKYLDNSDTGDLVQRSTSDVETIRTALSTQVVEVSNALILMATALPLMIFIDWRMGIASFILIGPISLFGYFYFGRVRHAFLAVDEAEGKVTSVVQENLTGLRVVRAFARQKHEIKKFAAPNQEYRDKSLRMLRLMAWYWSISDFIALTQNAIVLGAGIYFISQGTLTVGNLFAFLMLLNLLLWPVRQMGRILTDFGKSIVAIVRIREILDEKEETRETFKLPVPTSGKLKVRDLSFSHGESHATLNGISFEVEAGETLAILGPSGSGKSTLMHLLLRLYEYNSGSIQLDGVELNTLNRQWCRSQFGTVMQEPFLFSKTIIENIRLGSPSADIGQVTGSAEVANIHDTINSFPEGYETLVGERGVTLSGGQRQRVALARALLREAPILLMDDALSAVDAETEEAILEALKMRHGKKTTLVIAHRLSTLAQADKVIVLDHGKIVQQGTHDTLSREDGLYRRLWEIQNLTDDSARESVGQGAK